MNRTIKVAQILWLKISIPYFGTFGDIHPYLVLKIHEDENSVELGQLHSLEGKGFEAISESNVTIYSTFPNEVVLPKDSFLQMNNIIKIEYFDELKQYLRTEELLSEGKFTKVLRRYEKYQNSHVILDDRVSYMSKDEIIELNS